MLFKKFTPLALLIVGLLFPLSLYGQQQPNIIVILADDMGYGDLGCYGQQKIHTPNIDSLAAGGIRFTDYYAGCTVCAPSRESLLTGMTTGHTAIRGNFLTDQQEDPPLPANKITLAEIFKKAGYVTGLYGKWGLGGENHGPATQGFDSSFCYLDQIKAHNYYPPYLYHNGRRVAIPENENGQQGKYSHDIFVEQTLGFLRNHQKDQPFFLYLPYTLPHGSYSLPPEAPYASKDWPKQYKVYASMISKLDKDVGRIMQLLRQKQLLKSTLIFFLSDNGANRAFADFFKSNGPFRGTKRDLYEGGIRMPLIAYWKGTIAPGQVTHHVTAAWDFLPTLCQVADLKTNHAVDGVSFLPTLLNQPQMDHPYLYWEYYQYNYNWYKKGDTLPRNYLTNRAVRYGNWKAVQNHLYRNPAAPIQLYDLSTDQEEQHDLAAAHPEVVRKIKDILAKSSTDNAPFFPYPPDQRSSLHTFAIATPEMLKDFFHYTPDRIPLVSSHRGAPTLGYPENSLAAFRHTLRHSWSILEIDPHFTKDSAIVLMHDPTLERTSTGQGKISDHSLKELKQLYLKDPEGHVTRFRIPTLDEALQWAKGKTVLILDQKDVPAAVRAQKIKAAHAQACAMVMCYSYEDAKAVYAIDSNIMMEVFIPNIQKAETFDQTGVPWRNIVAFVTHGEPKDKAIFQYLHDKGVMTIRGSSRNVDRAFLAEKISKNQLEKAYRNMIETGTDIIEADLGVQAGVTLQQMPTRQRTKSKYFKRTVQNGKTVVAR